MRRLLAGVVFGFALASALALPVAQTAYPVAVWPVADTSLATTSRLVRERLFAARTYYVRTDGSDSNCDGQTDASDASTATTACGFLTIQKAASVVYGTLDLSTYNVTIQVNDGTYTGTTSIIAPHVGQGTITIQGNSGTPANVLISTTSANGFSVSGGAVVTIKDLKIVTTTSGTGLSVDTNAAVYISNLDFGSAATFHMLADNGSLIRATGNYSITGGSGIHWATVRSSAIWLNAGITVTLTGTPAFSISTAYAVGTSNFQVVSITFSGSATGARYTVAQNGVINSGGATLPGNSAGSATTGGQYL